VAGGGRAVGTASLLLWDVLAAAYHPLGTVANGHDSSEWLSTWVKLLD
jgi:hypothetical protein